MATAIIALITAIIGTDANPSAMALRWATRPTGVSHEEAHKVRTRTFRALPHALKGVEGVPFGQALWNVAAHVALHDRPANVKAARETAAKAVAIVQMIARVEGVSVETLNAQAGLWRHEAQVSRATELLRDADAHTAELEKVIAATA